LLLIGSVNAQTRRISGKVISADDGTPLPGVSVGAVGTSSGGLTDNSGNFAFNAPADIKQIEFRYVGYTSVVIAVQGNEQFTVEMTPESTALDAVVIGAAGIKTTPREQGTQQTRINAAELTAGKPVNLATGLHAKVPGLQINAVSSGVNPNV